MGYSLIAQPGVSRADLDAVTPQQAGGVIRGTGSGAVEARDVINVMGDGIGARLDGVTDDSAAMQAAFDRARDSGAAVFIPYPGPGKYARINTHPLTIYPNLRLIGGGVSYANLTTPEATLRFMDPTQPGLKHIATADGNRVSFERLSLLGAGGSNAAHSAIVFPAGWDNNGSMRDCYIANWGGWAVDATRTVGVGDGVSAIESTGVDNVMFAALGQGCIRAQGFVRLKLDSVIALGTVLGPLLTVDDLSISGATFAHITILEVTMPTVTPAISLAGSMTLVMVCPSANGSAAARDLVRITRGTPRLALLGTAVNATAFPNIINDQVTSTIITASNAGRDYFYNADVSVNGGTTRLDNAIIGATGHFIGFYGASPVGKPTISGGKGGNVALGNLLTQLAGMGLITDSTT